MKWQVISKSHKMKKIKLRYLLRKCQIYRFFHFHDTITLILSLTHVKRTPVAGRRKKISNWTLSLSGFSRSVMCFYEEYDDWNIPSTPDTSPFMWPWCCQRALPSLQTKHLTNIPLSARNTTSTTWSRNLDLTFLKPYIQSDRYLGCHYIFFFIWFITYTECVSIFMTSPLGVTFGLLSK